MHVSRGEPVQSVSNRIATIPTRTCTRCHATKPVTEYSPTQYWCKERIRITTNDRRAKRKEALKAGVPLYRLVVEKRTKPNSVQRHFLPGGWPRFRQHVSTRRLLLYFDLVQSCGLRASEALALRKSDFDFEGGFVRVWTLKKRIRHRDPDIVFVRPDILAEIATLPDDERCFPFRYLQVWNTFKNVCKAAGLTAIWRFIH